MQTINIDYEYPDTMQTHNRRNASIVWQWLLVFVLICIMLSGVTACGKKGSLYLEPDQEKSEKK